MDHGVYGTESLFYNLSAIDSLGRVVEGGYLQDGDFVLLRYDAAGNPDSSFDGEQPVLSNPGNVAGLAVDPTTGTIVVAGCNSGGVYVDCFNNDGTPDGDQPYQPSIPNFSPAAVVAQGGEFFVAGALLVGSHYQPAVACFDQACWSAISVAGAARTLRALPRAALVAILRPPAWRFSRTAA